MASLSYRGNLLKKSGWVGAADVSVELRMASSEVFSSPSSEALLLVCVGVSRLFREYERSASHHVVAVLRLPLAHCPASEEATSSGMRIWAILLSSAANATRLHVSRDWRTTVGSCLWCLWLVWRNKAAESTFACAFAEGLAEEKTAHHPGDCVV
jgi:hypothetical protein